MTDEPRRRSGNGGGNVEIAAANLAAHSCARGLRAQVGRSFGRDACVCAFFGGWLRFAKVPREGSRGTERFRYHRPDQCSLRAIPRVDRPGGELEGHAGNAEAAAAHHPAHLRPVASFRQHAGQRARARSIGRIIEVAHGALAQRQRAPLVAVDRREPGDRIALAQRLRIEVQARAPPARHRSGRRRSGMRARGVPPRRRRRRSRPPGRRSHPPARDRSAPAGSGRGGVRSAPRAPCLRRFSARCWRARCGGWPRPCVR